MKFCHFLASMANRRSQRGFYFLFSIFYFLLSSCDPIPQITYLILPSFYCSPFQLVAPITDPHDRHFRMGIECIQDPLPHIHDVRFAPASFVAILPLWTESTAVHRISHCPLPLRLARHIRPPARSPSHRTVVTLRMFAVTLLFRVSLAASFDTMIY